MILLFVCLCEQIDVIETDLVITLSNDLFLRKSDAIQKLCEDYISNSIIDKSREVPMLIAISDERTKNILRMMAIRTESSVNIIEQKLKQATHVMTFLGENGLRHVDLDSGLFRIQDLLPKTYLEVEND